MLGRCPTRPRPSRRPIPRPLRRPLRRLAHLTHLAPSPCGLPGEFSRPPPSGDPDAADHRRSRENQGCQRRSAVIQESHPADGGQGTSPHNKTSHRNPKQHEFASLSFPLILEGRGPVRTLSAGACRCQSGGVGCTTGRSRRRCSEGAQSGIVADTTHGAQRHRLSTQDGPAKKI